MEEVSVIRTLSQSVSHAAKPSTASSPPSKSGRSAGGGTPTGSVIENGGSSATSTLPSTKKANLAEVREAVEDINHRLEVAHHTLRFQIDDATEEIKVHVVDKETGRVVRTIPPEPSLSILASGEFSGLFSVHG